MEYEMTGAPPRGISARRPIVLALAIALLTFGIASVAQPQAAHAGLKGKAKKLTKKKIKNRGAQPVKVSCKLKGKRGRDGAKCKWTYAELTGTYSVQNCKGDSTLKKKRGKLKFKKRSCKADRGAGLVGEGLPERLLKDGYEATFTFCFTTLGNGYKCKWEALQFGDNVIEDCKGTALSKNRNVTIKLKGCSRNEAATAAQAGVKQQLAAMGLNPGQVNCRPGSPIKCTYVATQSSGGWTYSCNGNATGSDPYGTFDVDACKLEAPDEAPLGGVGPHPVFGVNGAWGEFPNQAADLDQHFDAETARFTVNWLGVEPTEGATYDWDQPDTIYNAMVANGIAPILILQSAPCWATDDSCSLGEFDHPPSVDKLSAWADFVEEAVSQYPGALAVEVWNEANSDLFFHNAPRPARYEKLLEEAYDAVKSVDPNMPVITTGLAPYASDGPGAQRYDDFLRDVYKQGAKGHFDAVGHHGYAGRAFNEDYEQAIRIQIADLKDVMLDYGDRDMDIWITETGVSTKGNQPYNESQQATALSKLYKQYRRIPGIPTVVVHRWRDASGSGASGVFSAEAGYGLQRTNGSKKPAYCTLAADRTGSSPAGC